MPLNSISKGKGAFCSPPFPPPPFFFFLQCSNFVLHLFQTAFCNKNVWLPCTHTQVRASALRWSACALGLAVGCRKGSGFVFPGSLLLAVNNGLCGSLLALSSQNRSCVQNACCPQILGGFPKRVSSFVLPLIRKHYVNHSTLSLGAAFYNLRMGTGRKWSCFSHVEVKHWQIREGMSSFLSSWTRS